MLNTVYFIFMFLLCQEIVYNLCMIHVNSKAYAIKCQVEIFQVNKSICIHLKVILNHIATRLDLTLVNPSANKTNEK